MTAGSGGSDASGRLARNAPGEPHTADPDAAGPDGAIGRREFVERSATLGIAAGLACAGALPLAGCASLATVRLTPEDGVLRLPVRNHPRLEQPGGDLAVQAEGRAMPILVIARDDGSFLALSSECTHLRCQVEPARDRIVCPCHGSTFDREGEVLAGPAERPLERYTTRLRDDGVLEISL